MRLSAKLVASSAIVLVLAAAIVTSFMLVGAKATGVPAQVAASAAQVASPSTTSTEPVIASGYACVEFKVLYRTLAQLHQAADTVVRGKVIAVSFFDISGAAQTKVTFSVSKCYKGNVTAGDEITIVDAGGVISRAVDVGDKFGPPTKEDYETKVAVLMDGAPLAQVGEDCLYFLGVAYSGLFPGTYYCPMGSFQGRFVIHDGVAARYVPAQPEEMGRDYTSLAMDEAAIDDTIARAAAQWQ